VVLAVAGLVGAGSPAAAASFSASPTPTISGTARVGATLTVRPGTWRPTAKLRYQWYAGGVAVKGATHTAWVVPTSAYGKAVKVTVTGSRSGYRAVSRSSRSTAKVAAGTFAAPTPTIGGTVKVGSKLTAQPGTWKPTATLRYQWYAGGVAVTGATHSAWVVPALAYGKTVQVRVTGTRTRYATASRTSRATGKVAAGSFAAPVPTVAGTARVGSTLTAVPGTWKPAATLRYQWSVAGAAVAGATRSTWVVPASAYGKAVGVSVTGSAAGYATVTKPSGRVTVGAGTLTTTPTPRLLGTPAVGSTLTVEPGTWGPAPVTLRYQWNRDGTAVAGMTTTSYAVTTADAGSTLTVTVTGSRSGYASASRTSAAVGVDPSGRVRHVAGELSTNTTWTTDTVDVVVIDGTLTVPAGRTLRIGPGVVVKLAGAEGSGTGVSALDVYGALEVAGTASAPVVMTSYLDDTAGGDTNGDGADSAPADWGTSGNLWVREGAHLTIAHLDERYVDGITAWTSPSSGATTITDSHLQGTVQWGPFRSDASWPDDWSPSLTFERNTLTDGRLDVASAWYVPDLRVRDNVFSAAAADDTVASVDAPRVRPSWFTGNSSPTGGRIRLEGELAEGWTVADQGGIGWGVLGSLDIPAGVDVVAPAGTVLGSGLIRVYGTLTIAGTTEAPVRFADQDGSGWGGISVERDGVLHAEHLVLETSSYGDAITSGYADPAVIWVTDSTLAGGIDINTQDTTVTLRRNVVTGGGISVYAWFAPLGRAEVSGNAVDLAGADGPAVRLVTGELEPWVFAGNTSATPSELVLEGELTQDWTMPALPDLTWSPGLTVTGGAQLVVPAGMRLTEGTLTAGEGGTVVLDGTADAPVGLDGVGLTADPGGHVVARHATVRAASVTTYGTSTLDADDVVFVDHTDPELGACVVLDKDTTGHLRGNLRGCGIGLDARSAFDARYVDWGDPSGPAPFGTGAEAVGPAQVVPWVGYTPPATPTVSDAPAQDAPRCAPYTVLAVRGSGEAPGGPFEVSTDPANYDHFSYTQMTTADQPSVTRSGLFAYAARGIGPKIQGILTGQRELAGEPWLVEEAGDGLLDQLDQVGYNVDAEVNVVPVVYPAASTELLLSTFGPSDHVPFFVVHADRFAEYLASIAVGVRQIDRYLDALETSCPDSQIALVGYSQGAMAIHMALADRAAAHETAVFDQINAVLLLADPLQDATADGTALLGFHSDDTEVQRRGLVERVVDTAVGRSVVEQLDPSYQGLLGGMLEDYPSALAGRTLTYCQVGDLLCAPQLAAMDFGDMTKVHTGYSVDQLTELATSASGFFPAPATQ